MRHALFSRQIDNTVRPSSPPLNKQKKGIRVEDVRRFLSPQRVCCWTFIKCSVPTKQTVSFDFGFKFATFGTIRVLTLTRFTAPSSKYQFYHRSSRYWPNSSPQPLGRRTKLMDTTALLKVLLFHFLLSSSSTSVLSSPRKSVERRDASKKHEIKKELIHAQSFLEVLRIIHPDKSGKEAWSDLLKESGPKIEISENKMSGNKPVPVFRSFAARRSALQRRRTINGDADRSFALDLFNDNSKSDKKISSENSEDLLNLPVDPEDFDDQNKNFACSQPTKLSVDVRKELGFSYDVFAYPDCLMLYKCSKEAGCCLSKETSCVSIKKHTVQKWVYIFEFGAYSQKLEKRNFTEDVECGCLPDDDLAVSKPTLSSCNRKCPINFQLVNKEGECSCHCVYAEDSDQFDRCKQVYRGKRELTKNDCSCVEWEKCNSPSCAPGLEFGLETCKCRTLREHERRHVGKTTEAEDNKNSEMLLIDDEDFGKELGSASYNENIS